jgi:hypothetical protein
MKKQQNEHPIKKVYVSPVVTDYGTLKEETATGAGFGTGDGSGSS